MSTLGILSSVIILDNPIIISYAVYSGQFSITLTPILTSFSIILHERYITLPLIIVIKCINCCLIPMKVYIYFPAFTKKFKWSSRLYVMEMSS